MWTGNWYDLVKSRYGGSLWVLTSSVVFVVEVLSFIGEGLLNGVCGCIVMLFGDSSGVVV